MTQDPESFVAAGQALIQLGRMLQRTFPKPNMEGCQFDEQSVLDKLLPAASGIYVEIGANDGVDCSNTWSFYKRGWTGLCIEPLIDCLPTLLLNRGRDIICPIASSDQEGYATLHCCRTVSSFDNCWRKDNEAVMPVMTERLGTALKRYPWIDWTKTDLLSIDCEGHEGAVLRGIPWEWFKPKVVVIEYADQDGNDISGAWPLVFGDYTEVHRNKLNLILKRK